MSQDVKSPITNGETKLIRQIDFDHLSRLFLEHSGLVIEEYIPKTPIEIRRCVETGYEFYYPHSLAGPAKLYADWYTPPAEHPEGSTAPDAVADRWEFAFARRHLDGRRSLLDVGCGGGDFLATVEHSIADRVGLETSDYGLNRARHLGVDVRQETVEEHASKAQRYDVVTAFQVLEHVPEVRRFCDACLELLADGGLFIVAVPNNDGFLDWFPELISNMPPHHVGLWRKSSLAKLGDVLDLTTIRIENEPLQTQNFGTFRSALEQKYMPRQRVLRSLFYRLGYARGLERFIEENAFNLPGHTVIAVFQKGGQQA